jgi:hypothetical protein
MTRSSKRFSGSPAVQAMPRKRRIRKSGSSKVHAIRILNTQRSTCNGCVVQHPRRGRLRTSRPLCLIAAGRNIQVVLHVVQQTCIKPRFYRPCSTVVHFSGVSPLPVPILLLYLFLDLSRLLVAPPLSAPIRHQPPHKPPRFPPRSLTNTDQH